MSGVEARYELGRCVLRSCRTRAAQPAVITTSGLIDYGSLGTAAERLATLLRDIGPAGSRLALLIDRSPELVVAQLAAVARRTQARRQGRRRR
jgi:acyl-CoA synthetase (AMP-forming)/AMP-acid ligase II